MPRPAHRLAIVGVTLAALACGGGGEPTAPPPPPPPPPNVTVTVTPGAASLEPGVTETFTATVQGSTNTSVTWTANGGTIAGSGATVTYTAPAAPGSYTLTATSAANSARSGSAAITVTPAAIAVVVGPTATRINTSERRRFAVVVTGTANRAVTWTASAGTIAGTGDTVTWTAPASAGNVTIRATSAADPTKSGVAMVAVDDPATGDVEGGELLRAAFESGALDLSTYTVYQVYWALSDPRLPSQYRGGGMGPGDLPEVLRVRPEGLTAAAIAELDRYTLPPNAPGSWYMLRNAPAPAAVTTRSADDQKVPDLTNWESVESANGKVLVWWDQAYPDHESKAELVAEQVDAIWSKYADLLGREPPSDGSFPSDQNGGDGRFDIYLTATIFGDKTYGQSVSYTKVQDDTKPCPGQAAFLLINGRKAAADLLGTVAHELFHAFQNAFPSLDRCRDIGKLHESTATWAEDFVFPAANTEWLFFGFFAEHTDPLLKWHQGYGAFVYFQYLTRTHSPAIMRTLWDNIGTRTSLEAIDAASPGGLAASYKDFAVAAWNQAPFDSFRQWDGISLTPLYRGASSSARLPTFFVVGEGQVQSSYPAAESRLVHTGIEYYRFTTKIETGRPAEMVRFNHPYGGVNPPGVSVQLLYRRGNHPWHRIDLGASGKTFCLSTPAESFDDFVVVVANGGFAEHIAPEFTQPMADARVSCGDYVGEVTSHRVLTTETGNMTMDVKMEATGVRFSYADGAPPGAWRYKLAGGSVRASASGSRTGPQACQFESQEITIPLAAANGTLYTGDPGDGAADANPPGNTMHKGVGTVTPFSFTMPCVSGSTTRQIVAADINDWFHTAAESEGSMPWTASTSADRLEGTFTRAASGTGVTQTYTWTWRFERVRPPGW